MIAFDEMACTDEQDIYIYKCYDERLIEMNQNIVATILFVQSSYDDMIVT